VSRWQDEIFSQIQRNMADRTAPETFQLGNRTVHLPTLLDTIRFKASHEDPRVQVADVLAGAAAHVYEVATGTRRNEGGLLRLLQRSGLIELLQEGVIPNHE
jgi:hypothetical protein